LRSSALATLAVMPRESSRFLLFDDVGLFGRADEGKELRIRARTPVGEVRPLAFGGVHVIAPSIFDLMEGRDGVFSILDVYLDAVAGGRTIHSYRIDAADWIDIGRPDRLGEADRRAREASRPTPAERQRPSG